MSLYVEPKTYRCPRCEDEIRGFTPFAKHVKACKAPKKIKPEPTGITVPCLDCGMPFPNAKELGIHRTKTHFGEQSLGGSTLGDWR